MDISQADWIAYKDKLSAISETAADKFEKWLTWKGGYQNVSKKEMINMAYALSTKYGEAAASLAAQMYDETAALSGVTVPAAEVANTASYGEIAKAINGVTKTLTTDKNISNVVARHTKMAGADTTLKNAARDGAEFAWIPAGDTCIFCLEIASNGWRHISAKSMKNGHAEHIHANCDCTYSVRFDGKSNVKGYNPDKYKEMFKNAEGNTSQERVNSLRRIQYQENKDKINAQKRANYASKNKDVLNNKKYMNYGAIIHGKTEKHSVGGNLADIVTSSIKVEFEGKSVYISDKIYDNAKDIMDRFEPYLKNALNLVGKENREIPNFIIADATELTKASGRYLYEPNTVVLVPKLFGDMSENDKYNKHLTIHELLHWGDCQDMSKKYPNASEDELVNHVINWAKDKLDKIGIDKYSVTNISSYAREKFSEGRFDEVYVEYRTKQLMGGG